LNGIFLIIIIYSFFYIADIGNRIGASEQNLCEKYFIEAFKIIIVVLKAVIQKHLYSNFNKGENFLFIKIKQLEG
jgi:hypothetical protein